MPTMGRFRRVAAGRAEEAGVTEREDAAVGCGEPVAVARWCGGDADDRLVETDGPVEPTKRASPNAKMPPSVATSQYPFPDGVGLMSTIARFRTMRARRTVGCGRGRGRTAAEQQRADQREHARRHESPAPST